MNLLRKGRDRCETGTKLGALNVWTQRRNALRLRQNRVGRVLGHYAIEHFRDALEIQPTFTEAQLQLDRTLGQR